MSVPKNKRTENKLQALKETLDNANNAYGAPADCIYLR